MVEFYGRFRLICSWLDNDDNDINDLMVVWKAATDGAPGDSSFPTIFVDIVTGVVTKDEKPCSCYLEMQYNWDNFFIISQSVSVSSDKGPESQDSFIHPFIHQDVYLIPDSNKLAVENSALSMFPFVSELADQGGRHGK